MILWPGLLIQAGFVLATFLVLGVQARGRVFYRCFHAGGFYALFYTLFFLLPQALGASDPARMIIGYEAAHEAHRGMVFLTTQLRLIGFTGAIFLGAALSARFLPPAPPSFAAEFPCPLPVVLRRSLWLFLLAGLLAHALLAWQSLSLTGYRSDLVKTPLGMALTALSFQANFALALLGAEAVLRRRWLLIVLLIAVFAPLVVVQGARGRLLWPLLILAMLVAGHANRLPVWRSALLGLLLLLGLSVMDPLRFAFLQGISPDFSLGEELAKVFVTRTFDGFASFALILEGGRLPPSPDYLRTGIREAFMMAYYPEVLRQGVAFGSGLPGWFYLSSGGGAGFLALSALYGGLLGALTLLQRRSRHIGLSLALLFACSWLCAVGGDFIESLDKMLAAAAAGLVLAVILPRRDPSQDPRQAPPRRPAEAGPLG